MRKDGDGTRLAALDTDAQIYPSPLDGSLRNSVDVEAVADAVRTILVAIGEDPHREGLVETPARVARWWEEFVAYEPGRMNTTFESVTTDQMVVVSGLRVWSLCEHHLLPFWCDVSVGYIARDKVIGLSKIARIAHFYAHRLQIQERLTDQIADHLCSVAQTSDVAVFARGQHLCMVMRGIKTDGLMTSTVMRGVFREEPETRAEFLSLIGQR